MIPLFHDQIRKGGPVTVTVPEMTRFLLSLDQAVNTLIAAIRSAKRGEIYVPIVSAATVLNIAKALIGKRKIDIKITGIRPAEKLHEIMVSEEDVMHCVRRGDSSSSMVLDLAETAALLKKHKLMIENVDGLEEEELLR